MKTDIAQQWVDALRSGRYKQGRNALKQDNGEDSCSYCCLGVLCDLYQSQTDCRLDERTLGAARFVYIGGESEFLPSVVAEWAGMKSRIGKFNDPISEKSSDLANLNDTGTSFEQLAHVIENHKEEL